MAKIARLTLSGMRNLESLDLSPDLHTTLITGRNGAGKTAILEAIHILASGRSFRESRLQRCQQWQAQQLTLFAQVNNRHGNQHLGWQRQQNTTSTRLNGDHGQSQAALALHLPVQVFSPESQDMLTQGPNERRRFIDWGTFYQHPEFLSAWRAYNHALKQRNHALRQQRPEREITVWHAPLWQAAQQIDQARHDYVEHLNTQAQQLAPHITDSLVDLSLSYSVGWNAEVSLLERWQQQIEQDRQLGYTQSGPHRADLKIKTQGRDALSVLSRGQQKLLALTLLLTQTQLLSASIQETPILLLDDLPAELDAAHRERVLTFLPSLSAQLFLTSTDSSSLPFSERVTHWMLDQGKYIIKEA
jgi:DNA replication and repair protein RecF